MSKQGMNRSLLIYALVAAALLPWCGYSIAAEQATDGTTKPSLAGMEEARAARQALDRFVNAYQNGNAGEIRAMLDPSMIGYQQFIDGVQRNMSMQKQIRIHFYDTQVIAGPDVTVVHTRWEKRFLSVTNMEPGLHRGFSSFLLHRTTTGWKLAALAGDNMVVSTGGTLARLTFQPSTIAFSSLPVAVVAAPPPMSGFTIEVADPDLIGRGSINVDFRTSQGDNETFALTETSPGRFVRNTLNIEQSVVGAGPTVNGRLVIDSSPLPATVTMRYIDQNPGNGQPPRALSTSITIQ